jgi:hypothetical protein
MRTNFCFTRAEMILLLFVGMGLSGCRGPAHNVSLSCQPKGDGSLQFTFSSQNINGVFQFVCWSESKAEPLWAFRSLGWIKPNEMQTMTYGVLPKVASPDGIGLKQVFPRKNAKTRAIQPGEQFVVLIAYQYDAAAAPCVGFNTSYFAVEQDRSIKSLRSGMGFPNMPPEVGKVWDVVCDPMLDDDK